MKTRILPFLITFSLACFGLSPAAKALLPPPAPDGGYPGGNTAEGTDALFSLTSGVWNTALGTRALNHNTNGGGNTATGFESLFNNTTGGQNTAYGSQSLYRNSGSFNTPTGYHALFSNDFGANNTANGAYALNNNAEGVGNTANGYSALFHNDLGIANTANGNQALFKNTAGNSNTATGAAALLNNTAGSNTANGANSLFNNTTGDSNIADGNSSLMNNTTGSGNIALGSTAGLNLTTGSFNIDIGNQGVAGEANTIRVGSNQTATYIAGITGATVPSGVTVIVGSDGHLGTIVSSARFKDEIKPMDKVSEAILALRPVTFRYKRQLDPEGIPQFGLVAEDVEKVNPDLVARDAEGKPYTVRYDAVNAMLLNEFLKEHQKMQEEQATITELKSTVAQQQKDFQATAAHQQKQIEALTAGLQKVSAQLELNNRATQTVLNNP
jgi:Chaperone of endosialidase